MQKFFFFKSWWCFILQILKYPMPSIICMRYEWFAYNSTLSFSSQLSTPFRSPYKWKGKKKTCDFRPEVFKFVPGSLLCYCFFFFHYLMLLALGIWDLNLKAKKILVCVVVCAFPFRNCLDFIFSLSTLTITITHKIFIHDNPSCSIYMWLREPQAK